MYIEDIVICLKINFILFFPQYDKVIRLIYILTEIVTVFIHNKIWNNFTPLHLWLHTLCIYLCRCEDVGRWCNRFSGGSVPQSQEQPYRYLQRLLGAGRRRTHRGRACHAGQESLLRRNHQGCQHQQLSLMYKFCSACVGIWFVSEFCVFLSLNLEWGERNTQVMLVVRSHPITSLLRFFFFHMFVFHIFFFNPCLLFDKSFYVKKYTMNHKPFNTWVISSWSEYIKSKIINLQ